DLYSLGAILYEMLAGRPPFRGDAISLMYQHLHEPPPALPSSVPEALRDLVTQLLAKTDAQRPRDAASVGAVLAQLLSRDTADPSPALADATAPTITVTRAAVASTRQA